MIPVDDQISIDENEIQFNFIRASGPGGQRVNKASTAVQLRFDVRNSPCLSEPVRARLLRLAGKRVSRDGVLTIEADTHRKQAQNRQDALDRLIALIRQAAHQPKGRIPTKPSRTAKQRRKAAKRHRSLIKKMRRPVGRSDE